MLSKTAVKTTWKHSTFQKQLFLRNVKTNQPIKELTEGRDLRESASRRPSVCLALRV